MLTRKKSKIFLMILRRKEGFGNSIVVIRVAQAKIEKSTDKYLKNIDLISITWTPSPFWRVGFVRRMRTTDKMEIRDRAVMESKLLFQHQIANLVEEHNISPSLFMNFDKSSLKYNPVSNSTLLKNRWKRVPVAGGTYKE